MAIASQSWIKHAFFLGALLTAFFLYTFHITSDLYGDEYGHTYKLISADNFWSALKDEIIIHPPLYFILAKFSKDLLGMDWAIRIPSLIFALGTVFLLPFIAQKVLGGKYFLIAGWLGSLSPFLLEFAAEGRPYSMLIFFSVALIWSFLNFFQEENLKNMLLLTSVIIGGALTHYFFWLQMIFIGIYYLFLKRQISRYALGVLAMVGIILTPLFLYLMTVPKAQYVGYVQDSWALMYFNIPNFLARLAMALNFGYSTFHLPNLDPARNFTLKMLMENWITVLLVLFSLIGITYASVKMAFCKKKWFWFFALGMILPITIGVVAGSSGRNLIREKHLAVVWICNFFLFLFAFDYLIRTKKGVIIVACYMSVVFLSIFHYLVYPNEYSRRMDWTGLNRTLEQQMTNPDLILLYTDGLKSLSLGKMGILDSHIRQGNIQIDKPPNVPLSEYLKALSQSTGGTIYLINHEEQRLMVDPNGEAINILKTLRFDSEQRFGRNLILYIFKPELR
jgi:4-amino-4-deoxy-L-arabinose transferase-like glycosyltransferase